MLPSLLLLLLCLSPWVPQLLPPARRSFSQGAPRDASLPSPPAQPDKLDLVKHPPPVAWAPGLTVG